MSVATYTKSGTKATTAAKLDKSVFGVEVPHHELVKQAYVAYLSNGRIGSANVKTRGLVRGGGRKPWKQKGTGRARFGSTRNPIWRGGGIVFGPTGNENYTQSMQTTAKRQALRQALTLKQANISVIETFECKDGKVAQTAKFLDKVGAKGNTLIVVSAKTDMVDRATRNLQNVKPVQANYLNVYDIINADTILISKKSLEIIHNWLGADKPATKKAEATK